MLFLLLLFSYSLTTSKPLLLGGGASLTLRFETLFTSPVSCDAAVLFETFLVVEPAAFGAGTAFFPAEQVLELAHHFVLAKFEPFACAARTMSSGLGSENALETNEDDQLCGIA